MSEQINAPSKCILLADDSLPGLLAVKAMLCKRNHVVTTAADGEEAVELAYRQAFDLLLLDEHMPGLRGSQVVAALRAEPGPNQQARIIALSGESSPEVLATMRAAGFDDCIAKPVTAEQLDILLEVPAVVENSEESAVLEQLFSDLGNAAASRLLGLFVEELQQLTSRLRSAQASSDEEELLAVAHILKNSAALYGAEALAELASNINEQGERGDMSMAQPLLEHCEQAVRAATARLAVAGGNTQ